MIKIKPHAYEYTFIYINRVYESVHIPLAVVHLTAY